MPVRVDPEGFGMDPQSGGQSSGARVYDDGTRPPPWEDRPWRSATEGAVGEAVRLMSIPGEMLAQIRPPVPYQLFPEQELGFVLEQPTIDMVLQTDRWAPTQRSWFSPTVTPPVERRSYMDDAWSGNMRNVSSSPYG